MTQARIRAAFEAALSTWAEAKSPPVPVAWENVSFVQPNGRYVRAFLLPGTSESDDLSRTHRRWQGIFQVSVCMPPGVGPAASESIVDELALIFAPEHTMSAGGLTVWVMRPLSPGPAIFERDRYVIPCSVSYRADSY